MTSYPQQYAQQYVVQPAAGSTTATTATAQQYAAAPTYDASAYAAVAQPYQPVAYSPAPAYGVPGYGRDELRTIFVTGFPEDVREREVKNMCRFIPGYEVRVLLTRCHNVNCAVHGGSDARSWYMSFVCCSFDSSTQVAAMFPTRGLPCFDCACAVWHSQPLRFVALCTMYMLTRHAGIQHQALWRAASVRAFCQWRMRRHRAAVPAQLRVRSATVNALHLFKRRWPRCKFLQRALSKLSNFIRNALFAKAAAAADPDQPLVAQK